MQPDGSVDGTIIVGPGFGLSGNLSARAPLIRAGSGSGFGLGGAVGGGYVIGGSGSFFLPASATGGPGKAQAAIGFGGGLSAAAGPAVSGQLKGPLPQGELAPCR